MDNNKKDSLFLEGISLFNNREFYDAHESWEELWLEYHLPDKKFIQALIQLTVAYYHLSTGNKNGALSLLNKSLDKMELFSPINRNINIDKIIDSIHLSIDIIKSEEKFNWDIVPRLEIYE